MKLEVCHEGIAVVPDALLRLRMEGIVYRPIEEPTTSPIFMCFRQGDTSRPICQMKDVICDMYPGWGYAVPEGLRDPISD